MFNARSVFVDIHACATARTAGLGCGMVGQAEQVKDPFIVWIERVVAFGSVMFAALLQVFSACIQRRPAAAGRSGALRDAPDDRTDRAVGLKAGSFVLIEIMVDPVG